MVKLGSSGSRPGLAIFGFLICALTSASCGDGAAGPHADAGMAGLGGDAASLVGDAAPPQGDAGTTTTGLFVDPASATATLGGACSEAVPCKRINDALGEARRLRGAGHAERIHIRVAAGTYTGTYRPVEGQPATMEELPLLLNVPRLTLEGATVLGPDDAMGVPDCPTAGCYGTNITTADTAVNGEALILVAATKGGPAVSDVLVRGLSIYYPAPSAGLPLFFDRVTNLRIEGNFVTNGTTGPFGRLSTVEMIGNVVRGGAPAFCATAGTAAMPSRALVVRNRLEKSLVGGFLVGTTDIRDILLLSPRLELELVPIDASSMGNVISGAFVNNAMNDNQWAGMRLISIFNQGFGFPVPATGEMDVVVVGNTFLRNGRTGLSFDSGFSHRSRPEPLTGRFTAHLDDNRYEENGSWPMVISFNRLDPVGMPNNLAMWKFMETSTAEIWDADGETAAASVVNPACDPYPEPCTVPPANPLRNELMVHGAAAQPPERLRLLLDAARAAGGL
jgi:hypothetical protein